MKRRGECQNVTSPCLSTRESKRNHFAKFYALSRVRWHLSDEASGKGRQWSDAISRPCSEKRWWSFRFVAPILKGKRWKFSMVLTAVHAETINVARFLIHYLQKTYICRYESFETARRQTIWRNSTFHSKYKLLLYTEFRHRSRVNQASNRARGHQLNVLSDFDKVALNCRSDLQVSVEYVPTYLTVSYVIVVQVHFSTVHVRG